MTEPRPRGGLSVLPPSGSDPGTVKPLQELATAGEPKVFVARDPDALAEAAAVRLAERLVEAVGVPRSGRRGADRRIDAQGDVPAPARSPAAGPDRLEPGPPVVGR